MGSCKIGPDLYQYTFVDDCTRYRVLMLYTRREAANTLDFMDCVTEEMPCLLRRFRTDRGREFFALKVQEYCIKFLPNKLASLHVNDKVEYSQKTSKYFYDFLKHI
ncbi:TPA: DDE-type integrase/transposase/recombinase [Pluralibacter gergoviae]|uniref:Transposase n=1 Tax=Pluralibacter gergoviae TaxID=61647 RepID=A0A0J5MAZ7_PLUGE|nr:transposase [Pluralibacter gergoviae]KMK27379.1 transposase [Pluralibacter gergoviae]KOQ80635.1 transposase [Pluralibacter gergoviae]MBL3694909.1 transposase family protein [Pluralibacter gergoviae]HDS1151428.1 DDE-type integrase/transposase/recombinase [Pluralibacter gergoviae]